MTPPYVQPKVLRWRSFDHAWSERYQLFVFDNDTVCSAVGRVAHSSGSTSCAWVEFLARARDELVASRIGLRVLGGSQGFANAASEN